jgi:hypothetical protein
LFGQAAAIDNQYNGAGVRLSKQVANATVYDCTFHHLTAYGYGGGLWLDTPDANVLRCCGDDVKANHMGGFVHLGGVYNANSNRRVTECSVFWCGEVRDSGSPKGDGGGAIATDRDWIKVTSVNLSKCEGRQQRDRVAGIAIAFDASGDQPRLTGQFLLLLECTSAYSALALGNAKPSTISHSQFLNNTVSWVIHTYVHLNVTHCTFSDFGNLITAVKGNTGTNPEWAEGMAFISDCYFAAKEVSGELLSLTDNRYNQSVIPLQDFSAGLSYCPALPAQTLTVATETPSLTREETPSLTPEETPLATLVPTLVASLSHMLRLSPLFCLALHPAIG